MLVATAQWLNTTDFKLTKDGKKTCRRFHTAFNIGTFLKQLLGKSQLT